MAVRTSPPQIYVHAVFVSELRSTLFAYRSHLFARIFHRPFFLRAPAISFCLRLLSSLGVFLLQFLLLIRSSCFYILVHFMFSMLRTILCAMLTTMRCAILSRGGPRIQEGARVLKGEPVCSRGGKCSRGARGRVGQGARRALCSRGPDASGAQVRRGH